MNQSKCIIGLPQSVSNRSYPAHINIHMGSSDSPSIRTVLENYSVWLFSCRRFGGWCWRLWRKLNNQNYNVWLFSFRRFGGWWWRLSALTPAALLPRTEFRWLVVASQRSHTCRSPPLDRGQSGHRLHSVLCLYWCRPPPSPGRPSQRISRDSAQLRRTMHAASP